MHFGDVSETKRQKTLSDHVTRSAIMSLVVQVHLTTGKKTSLMSDSTVNFLFPIFNIISEVEKSLSTNLTKELNPKVNMAVRFHVKCRAKGYKLTAVSAEVTNETIDCQKEPQTCGGKKIF